MSEPNMTPNQRAKLFNKHLKNLEALRRRTYANVVRGSPKPKKR
jgi:hypothetical protein